MEYFNKELDSIIKLKTETFSEKDYDFIYVMTDLHGSYNAFEKFYSKINKEHGKKEKILFIITGDSCDRGSDTKKLYDIYNEINKKENRKVIHLLGNHEEILLNSVKGKDYLNHWLSSGGINTIFSFDEDYQKRYNEITSENLTEIYFDILNSNYNFKEKFLEYYKNILSFPLIVESESYIFVHAGLDFSKSLKEQDINKVLWRRDKWQEYNSTGKTVFYGHTPQKKANNINNCINLDTGISFGLKMPVAKINARTKKIQIIETK